MCGRAKRFFYSKAPRPALGPTKPFIQVVPIALSQGISWPESETQHPSPPREEFKNVLRNTVTLLHAFML
jgi:hypothetical protein